MKEIQAIKTEKLFNPSYNNNAMNLAIVHDTNIKASMGFHSRLFNMYLSGNTHNNSRNIISKNIKKELGHPFFTNKAFTDMSRNLIPDFKELYDSYLKIETEAGKLLPAINFLPALRNFSLKKREIIGLLKNPESKHILVQNDAVKIILIRWEPGQQSDIHGHAIGGGLIKVLYGEIEESRYTSDRKQRLLSKSTYLSDHISYIDDIMGLHSVKNNQDLPALTLHIYTPGNFIAKK